MALPLPAVQNVRADNSSPDMAGARVSMDSADLTLEVLMRQALEVPGAASALLEAFAAQTRALRLVQEADARGAAQLPTELRHRLASVAARTPAWLSAEGTGVRA